METSISSPRAGRRPWAPTACVCSPGLRPPPKVRVTAPGDACVKPAPGLWLRPRPRAEEASESGRLRNGILLASLGAATAASQALSLLLPKGGKLEDGQGELSPPRRGPSSPSPGLRARWVAPLPWPSACPRGACAGLLCLRFVEWGEERDGVGGRRRGPGALRAPSAFPALAEV